jgi:hypothetical protein
MRLKSEQLKEFAAIMRLLEAPYLFQDWFVGVRKLVKIPQMR